MNIESNAADNTLLVISFRLGDAVFGIDAQKVQEVSRAGDITPVCHAPDYVVGIRNLRGRIVTVIDLRTRLSLGRVETGSESRILIVDGQGEPIGMLVDQVADTLAINAAHIQPAPPNVNGVQGRNLLGICRGGGRLVALLDVAAVLQIEASSNQPAPGEGRSA